MLVSTDAVEVHLAFNRHENTCVDSFLDGGVVWQRVSTSMPYRWRTDTLRAVVMGGMRPKASSRGKHRHSPASCAVLQVKQGRHQKAKQPERKKKKSQLIYQLSFRKVFIKTVSFAEVVSTHPLLTFKPLKGVCTLLLHCCTKIAHESECFRASVLRSDVSHSLRMPLVSIIIWRVKNSNAQQCSHTSLHALISNLLTVGIPRPRSV